MATRNALWIYELKVDGKTIAIAINLRSGSRVFFWKTVYDETYARFGPGNLLIEEFIKDAIENGVRELDMLSPAAPYKMVWATDEQDHAAFYVFSPTIAGRLLQWWKFTIAAHLRTYKRRLVDGRSSG